jgi:hypothetical protein
MLSAASAPGTSSRKSFSGLGRVAGVYGASRYLPLFAASACRCAAAPVFITVAVITADSLGGY